LASSLLSPLSLHDALPICAVLEAAFGVILLGLDESDSRCSFPVLATSIAARHGMAPRHFNASDAPQKPMHTLACSACRMRSNSIDRKSTRLNSSHVKISYA